MAQSNERRDSARRTLFEGSLDVEGMEDVLELYRDLFLLLEEKTPQGRSKREMTSEETRMRLAEGFTLIDPGDLLPEEEELSKRVREVVQVLTRHSEDPGLLTRDMAGLKDEPGELVRLAGTFLSEGEEALRKELEQTAGANPEVVMFVLFNALKGLFLGAAAQCEREDLSGWEKGYCPVCGGQPAVAYTLGEGGKRHLICFRCETHWAFRRLTCPYCEHESPKESGYLFSDDPLYRALSASVCGECQAYIKGWRVEGDSLGEVHPEIEDLKTPGFDRAVEEEGFSRGAPNIYGVWIGTAAEEEGRGDQN